MSEVAAPATALSSSAISSSASSSSAAAPAAPVDQFLAPGAAMYVGIVEQLVGLSIALGIAPWLAVAEQATNPSSSARSAMSSFAAAAAAQVEQPPMTHTAMYVGTVGQLVSISAALGVAPWTPSSSVGVAAPATFRRHRHGHRLGLGHLQAVGEPFGADDLPLLFDIFSEPSSETQVENVGTMTRRTSTRACGVVAVLLSAFCPARSRARRT